MTPNILTELSKFPGVKSVYDTAPWLQDANQAKNKRTENMYSLSTEQLGYWKTSKKEAKSKIKQEKFLTTNTLMTNPFLKALVGDGFHVDKQRIEEKLKNSSGQNSRYTNSDFFESSFHDLTRRLPAFSDFLLPNTEALARTPRHSVEETFAASEDPFVQTEVKTSRSSWADPSHLVSTRSSWPDLPHLGEDWIDGLATLSPDQVVLPGDLTPPC